MLMGQIDLAMAVFPYGTHGTAIVYYILSNKTVHT